MAHYYKENGDPCHWIVGKNGKERSTTLRDARKLNLAPSVTEIINIAAKPGLEKWKRDNLLLAALTLPRIDGESLDSFSKRAMEDSWKQAEESRDNGVAVHKAIELLFSGVIPAQHKAIAEKAQKYVYDLTGLSERWKSEAHFNWNGYGGMVDLSHHSGIVIDFKTKEKIAEGQKLAWPEQAMQLSAYAHGLGMPDATKINVFVPIVEGEITHHIWEEDYYPQFECLLKYWQLSKKYAPRYDEAPK